MTKEQQREQDWQDKIAVCPQFNKPELRELFFTGWWDGFYRAEHQSEKDKQDREPIQAVYGSKFD
jgi:hypothetical protein